MNQLQLTQAQGSLSQAGYKLSCTHTTGSQNTQHIDTITCQGKRKWDQKFANPMGGYGMYRDIHFLSLTDNYLGFVQTYEHERGGHVDQFLHVLDFQGNLHWSFSCGSLDLNQGIISSSKLWLFHADNQKLTPAPVDSFYRKILLQLDIESGQEDFHRDLGQLKHLETVNPALQEWLEVYEKPSKLEMFEKRGKIFIQFAARTQEGNVPQKIKVVFEDLLAYLQ